VSDGEATGAGGVSRRSRYRHGLQTAIGASAGPYGYTLTIWTSGAVLIHQRGLPSAADALLFMAGSVLAFSVLGALAFRRGTLATATEPRHPVLWGSFHFLPVAAAIGAATLLGEFVHGDPVWPLAGLVATWIYLALVGAQIAVFAQGPPRTLVRLAAHERAVAEEVRDDVRDEVREAERALEPEDRADR